MNDPHVTALHYWVNHDDSVDYDDAQPLEFENELFHFRVNKKKVTIRPKVHFATEEEAREAVELLVRNWEFDAALDSGSNRFSLIYGWTDICDRNPTPTPTPAGVIQLSAQGHFAPATGSVTVKTRRRFYPDPPSSPTLYVDAPHVQAMLSRLERYYKGGEPLGSMAYFCLTTLQDSVPKFVGEGEEEKRTRDYYAISRRVQKLVSRLSSEKGGSEARKGAGFDKNFTKEERTFLEAAVRAIIRRAAEKHTNPELSLPAITLADFPPVSTTDESPQE